MTTTVNQIGVITYKNYEERVIIDNNFNTNELYAIIENDPDFVSFHIDGQPAQKLVTVKKSVEILGTTYNAFAKNPYTHKTKTTWHLSSGGYFYTKKSAMEHADYLNRKMLKQVA